MFRLQEFLPRVSHGSCPHPRRIRRASKDSKSAAPRMSGQVRPQQECHTKTIIPNGVVPRLSYKSFVGRASHVESARRVSCKTVITRVSYQECQECHSKSFMPSVSYQECHRKTVLPEVHSKNILPRQSYRSLNLSFFEECLAKSLAKSASPEFLRRV